MDSLAALITNKTWKLYRLSPLYKFKVSHNSLEAYSAQLKKHLKAEYQQANEVINAKIYSVKNREAAKEGDESVVIAVMLQKQNKVETSFLAIFSSVGVHHLNNTPRKGPEFTLFPLLLVRGTTSSLAAPTLSWIQLRFDCCMKSLIIPSYELARMAASWAVLGNIGAIVLTPSETQSKKSLELTYAVPPSVTGLKNITLNFSPTGLTNLYKEITKTTQPGNVGEVLLSALQQYFDYHFHINTAALSLIRIGTGVAFIDNEGKVKTLSNHYELLDHITEIMARCNYRVY